MLEATRSGTSNLPRLIGRKFFLTCHSPAPRLTPANHREVLDSARGKKKREIEEIVAALSPRPDVAPSVRKLPAIRLQTFPPAEAPVAPVLAAVDPAVPVASETRLSAEPLSAPRAAVTPLSPDRYKLQLTIGGDTLEKLRLAKDMLSHAIPSGDDAAVLDRALTALLADHRPDRPSLQRAPVRGIPSRGSPRPRRRGNGRQDRIALPASQRLRRQALLREAPPARHRSRARGNHFTTTAAVRASRLERNQTTRSWPAPRRALGRSREGLIVRDLRTMVRLLERRRTAETARTIISVL